MIIVSIVKRLHCTTHKYGIEILTSIKHAKALDKKNENTYWAGALNMYMENVSVYFDILKDNQRLPAGSKKATDHLVWDVKMNFTQKSRWVKDGHNTTNPKGSNFAGVVSRDIIFIIFTYTALNDLDV